MPRPPVIRDMILCEEIVRDPDHPRRISLLGLLSNINSLDDVPYPLLFPEICVFVQMTQCTGVNDIGVRIEFPDTGNPVFQTKTYPHSFGNDPLAIHGLSFRIKNCSFPEPGLYSFEFCYNDSAKATRYLLLR